MQRYVLALALFASFLSGAVRADWVADSDATAMAIMAELAPFDPEGATQYGLAQYDGEIADFKPRRFEREVAANEAAVEKLRAQLAQADHPKLQQDLNILIASLEDDIATLRIERDALLAYLPIHQLVFYGFNGLLDPRNDKARYPSALQRLAKYTGAEPGYTPLVELAKARTAERFDVAELVGPYRKELEDDLGNSGAYVDGIRELFVASGLTGWEADFAVLEEQLADYDQWLRKELLPRARDNNLLPPAVYANNLKNFGVRATPEELIAQGQYSYQLLRSEMKALAWRIAEQRGWKQRDLISVIHKLKREQIPADEVLPRYQARLADIEAIIEREQLVSLPERDASIRLATEAESAAIPASFMSPPQLVNNTGQYGEFVLVQSNPALKGDAQMDDWTHESIVWALTVHEARPGHELQFAKLVENRTSLARALFAFNSANAEGWGLYAESIMQEFLPLEGQLFNLYTRLMRAARMFLDPMVNTGQISRQQAEDFLVEQTALSRAMAASEADRYAFRMPGQATSYYYGYVHLSRLRTEVELALGDKFNQKAFHDFILEQGLLPPELLRAAVLEHFVK
jgi:hypothetical protein